MAGRTLPYVLASVAGGLVVALVFVVAGWAGGEGTRTVIAPAPVRGQAVSSVAGGLSAHDIYVRDAPGVVFVRAEVIQQVQDPFDLFPVQQSSVSTGSGFRIDRRGYILTNYHVVQGADARSGITVGFEHGAQRRAILVGQAPNNDLALLKVNLAGLGDVARLPLGDSAGIAVGDLTLAIGGRVVD
jgi:S1-C subfamily serine protease